MGSKRPPDPNPEIESLIQTFTCNPTIFPVGILIVELEVGEPFIQRQIYDLTGKNSSQIKRNLDSLVKVNLIEDCPAPEYNKHLHPYARLEHPYWDFFRVARRILADEIIYPMGKQWHDLQPWLPSESKKPAA